MKQTEAAKAAELDREVLDVEMSAAEIRKEIADYEAALDSPRLDSLEDQQLQQALAASMMDSDAEGSHSEQWQSEPDSEADLEQADGSAAHVDADVSAHADGSAAQAEQADGSAVHEDAKASIWGGGDECSVRLNKTCFCLRTLKVVQILLIF